MGIIGQIVGTVVGFVLGGWHGALLGNFIGFCGPMILYGIFGIIYSMAQDPEVGHNQRR